MKKELSITAQNELIQILRQRFEHNQSRHQNLDWHKIQAKMEQNPEKLWTLNEMEMTGGEPDVIAYDEKTDKFTFYDCSTESPKGRRSLCYDEKALLSRKANKPKDSAQNLAFEMGLQIMNEAQYRHLQTLGDFDTKTSNWIETPDKIRNLGGALFCDFRYDSIFVYHNGADSYYAARGFRGVLIL